MAEKNKNLQEPDIDLSYLRDVAGGDPEFMTEVINIFLAETPGYFENIRLAIEEKDWAGIVTLAHKMDPTFFFMGADSVRTKLLEIEHKAINSENMEEIEVLFNEVQSVSIPLFAKLEYIKTIL